MSNGYSTGKPDPRLWVSERLDTNGDGSGAVDAIGDYTGGQDFKITADQRELLLTGLAVKVRGTGQIVAEGYCTLPELASGVSLFIRDAGNAVVTDFMAGEAIKNNADWIELTTNVVISDYGSGDNFIGVGFRVPNPDEPIYLPPGYSLAMHLRDNMAGIVRQTFFAFGRYAK